MENTRVSFEITHDKGISAEVLSSVAKESVEAYIRSDIPQLTAEEYAEMARRSERLRLHPETGVAGESVYDLVMSRLCAEV